MGDLARQTISPLPAAGKKGSAGQIERSYWEMRTRLSTNIVSKNNKDHDVGVEHLAFDRRALIIGPRFNRWEENLF